MCLPALPRTDRYALTIVGRSEASARASFAPIANLFALVGAQVREHAGRGHGNRRGLNFSWDGTNSPGIRVDRNNFQA